MIQTNPISNDKHARIVNEKKLKQQAAVFWFTGLSGAGKTTLALSFEKKLIEQGFLVQVLDGDNMRTGINADLGFSLSDRTENIRRVAEVAKLFVNAGVITIVSFISPTLAIRSLAKKIIGESDFYEIYINAPLVTCETRDVKGLYKKARAGLLPHFTGIDSPYEAPEYAHLEIDTSTQNIEQSCLNLFGFAKPIITHR